MVGPGEFAELAVRFDPSHDPVFRGGLSVEVDAIRATGEVAFLTTVHLEVKAQPLTDSTRDAKGIRMVQRGGIP